MPAESIRSPGAGIAGSCEPWVLGTEIWSFTKAQYMPFMAEPTLQPPNQSIFNYSIDYGVTKIWQNHKGGS